MLRLVQTSDVHLGARHPLLGEVAGVQRERQFEAFDQVVRLALTTPADLVLIAGDLFDSSVQSRALIERTAAILKQLVAAGTPIVLIPGGSDAAGRASLYAAYDLTGLVGDGPGAGSLSILSGDAEDVIIPSLNARVSARFPASDLPDDGWRIGVVHREARPRDDEIAGAGVDYLAIGGPHTAATGRAATVSWGVSGAPELVDVEHDVSGEALLVTLDEAVAQPKVDRVRVGQTRYERLDLDLPTLVDQTGLVQSLAARADPNLILDVHLGGAWPDTVEVDTDDAEATLADRFLRIRIRNVARPTPSPRPLPTADTIAGAFLRDLETRVADAEAAGNEAAAAELREALRAGRRALAGLAATR